MADFVGTALLVTVVVGSGGELAQVVNAEAFFDVGDFIDHPLKTRLAEPSVLLVFKGLS